MKEKDGFGIVITCYRGDIHFTKGLLASIRYFCGDIPVCLIVDGKFSIKALEKAYNIVKVIRKNDVQNDFLRENCFGTRFTNLIAFFESPFERFLYIDSDTVLWGNVLENFDPHSADFVHNEPHESYSPFIMKHQYFDYDRIFEHTEYFKWEGCHFFNAGIFVMKRGIFNIEEISELVKTFYIDRKLLPRDIQGVINIPVFRNFLKGSISVGEAKLQTIIPLFQKTELNNKFRFAGNKPVVENSTILHWAGLKPHYRQDSVFNSPMNYFRKMNLLYTNNIFRKIPGMYFRFEELKAIYHVYYKNSPVKFLKRIFGGKK
jgi:hypothetical protein